MKKYIWLAIGLVIASLWILPETTTRPFMHFLILGIIPGTDIELGFILPLVAISIGVFILVRWLRQTSEALVEYKTEASHAEKRATELQVAAQKRKTEVTPTTTPVTDAEEIELQSI